MEVVDKKKKMENVNVKRLPFLSSNLIIEPHPEEYLADQTRKAAAKLDIDDHDKSGPKYYKAKECFSVENEKDNSNHFFKVKTSGAYSVSW